MGIGDTLRDVKEKMRLAARRAGRAPDDIKLVTVSKTVGLDKIAEAIGAGALILGENRVQEAKEKITNFKSQISNVPVEWHLIGNLQKNKAKTAVQLFDLIHSLDSYELAGVLNRHSASSGKRQRVLLQVKLSDESAKHGVSEKDVITLLEKVTACDHLALEGLMTMPPYFADPEMARPYFRRLREIRDRAAARGFTLPELSMGMTNDYEVAIEEGATIIRVGTAIFGERTY